MRQIVKDNLLKAWEQTWQWLDLDNVDKNTSVIDWQAAFICVMMDHDFQNHNLPDFIEGHIDNNDLVHWKHWIYDTVSTIMDDTVGKCPSGQNYCLYYRIVNRLILGLTDNDEWNGDPVKIRYNLTDEQKLEALRLLHHYRRLVMIKLKVAIVLLNISVEETK